MSYPNYFTDNGVGITNIAGDTKIGVGINGLEVEYDIGTPSVKKFMLKPNGVEFATNGITSYTTGLERLCAVQQAFQAVELPPNSTTLEVNKQLNLDDQLGNIGSIGLVGVDLVISNNNGVVKINDTLDMSGNSIINAGTITATNLNGAISVNNTNANLTHYLTMTDNHITGNYNLQADTGISCNPNANSITATTFIGALSGNATTATNVSGGLGGQILYQSAVDTTAKLANGTSGQVLTSQGTTLAPIWSSISTPSPTLTQTEDFINYSTNPQILTATGGIIGTDITFDIFNNTTGASSFTQNYTGSFNANLLSGALQRRGFNFIGAGPNSSSQQYSQQKYSFTNINKITWGFVPLGDSLVSNVPITGANTTYVLGLMGTRGAFAEPTSNSIAWTMDGVNGAGRGVETGFKFVINNVVRYSLVMNGGNMLNRWCRAGFTSTYVSGNTTDIQGFWTDLSTGLTETTAVYTITGGTGFVNPITTPNSAGIFQSAYSNTGNRYFLIDYCEVEQDNLYQIGVGSTQTTGR